MNGYKSERPLLSLAIEHDHTSIADSLLTEMAQSSSIFEVLKNELRSAVQIGNIKLTQYLVKQCKLRNIDLNMKLDDEQMTALHYAAQLGDEEIVQVLWRAGASTRSVNIQDVTPLQIAEQADHQALTDVIRKLFLVETIRRYIEEKIVFDTNKSLEDAVEDAAACCRCAFFSSDSNELSKKEIEALETLESVLVRKKVDDAAVATMRLVLAGSGRLKSLWESAAVFLQPKEVAEVDVNVSAMGYAA